MPFPKGAAEQSEPNAKADGARWCTCSRARDCTERRPREDHAVIRNCGIRHRANTCSYSTGQQAKTCRERWTIEEAPLSRVTPVGQDGNKSD